MVIPVYNEQATLEEILRRVRAAPLPEGIALEIVMVDDCSTDGTRRILERLEAQKAPDLRVFYHPVNRGKGAALRTGFAQATGDVVLVQDADLEYDPKDYPRLLEPILDGRADVVYGSRFLGGTHRVLFFWHYLANRVITLFCDALTNLNLTDVETCYKVIRTERLRRMTLRSDRFGFDPEFTVKMAKLGCRVYEVPISYSGRTYAEGKKITWRDGIAILWWIVRYRLAD